MTGVSGFEEEDDQRKEIEEGKLLKLLTGVMNYQLFLQKEI
jgi:hypothetical protein